MLIMLCIISSLIYELYSSFCCICQTCQLMIFKAWRFVFPIETGRFGCKIGISQYFVKGIGISDKMSLVDGLENYLHNSFYSFFVNQQGL